MTVPGAAWGWDAVLKRFGTRSLREMLQPAQTYAEEGFPVSERIASDWRLPNALPTIRCCTQPDPDSLAVWYPGGKPPVPGRGRRSASPLIGLFRVSGA